DTARSTMNPYNRGFDGFAYGMLPLFIVKGLSLLLKIDGFNELEWLGRATSATFDLGTVLLVFLLGRQLYGRAVGLLAAALAAFTVLQIQLAHFYTVAASWRSSPRSRCCSPTAPGATGAGGTRPCWAWGSAAPERRS